MEIWKEIYPDYFISTLGNIDGFKQGKHKRLKPRKNRWGYLQIRLHVGGERKIFTVHRLVATAFIPNPGNKPQINHINGIKTDNRVENLEWVTASENTRHAYAMGLITPPARKGEDSGRAKLTTEQVLYIRDNPDKLSQREFSNLFGVTNQVISDIQLGKTWKSVGGFIRKPKRSRLTDDARNEIKQLYIKGSHEFGCYGLAKRFGVDPTTISKIICSARC